MEKEIEAIEKASYMDSKFYAKLWCLEQISIHMEDRLDFLDDTLMMMPDEAVRKAYVSLESAGLIDEK